MKRAFTLVELLVVIGMIALLTGAIGTSVSSARARARIVKATAEVKEMTNAILAYENYARGGEYGLEAMENREATIDSVGFIMGRGETGDTGKIPVLYNGSASADGSLRDPWGNPYRVTIREGQVPSVSSTAASNMQTGYYLPNFYRLSIEERNK
ncbi:MAG: type II secretion system protein [Kiritimatiellae bacterium]|nr:type II secretion system protein [Kiritimatiellia bacterium]